MNRRQCLLIGAQELNWTTISLGCLKAAADADPALGGRIDVKILNLISPTAERIVEEVARRRPDVVGFSCYLWNTGVFFEALAAVRKTVPEALIVLGGPDVYPQARKVLETHPEVDVVVLGEAEVTFPRLLASWLDGAPWRDLPGLAFLRKGEFFQNPEPPPVKDLDSLPSPILSGALKVPADALRVTLETSRGCPFNCSFCDWPGRGQKPRTYSVDRVIAELAQVVADGKDLFIVQFADSDIFVDKARAKELLRRAKEVLSGTNIILWVELYLGRLDEELMRAADFPNLFLSAGVQTATPESLKTINRFFHREKIEAAIAGMRTFAPRTRVSLEIIYPLPGDTLEGFLDTYEWTLSLRPELIGAYPALILPGADMGLHPERYEFEYSERPPRRIVSLPRFGAADIRRAAEKVFRVSILQRVPFVRNTLAHLAEFEGGRAARPLLDLYEEFAADLAREELLPLSTASDPLEEAFSTASQLGHELMRDGAALENVMTRLRLFASSVLHERGRADALAVFERYWRIELQFVRWIHLTRTSSAGLNARVDADASGARRLLWLGLESLADEAFLPHRAGAAAEIVHLMAEGTRPYHCLQKVRHAGFEGLGRRDDGKRADAIVLSHLFTRSTPAERDRLLSYASQAAGPESRIIVWDGLLGRSPLESLRRKSASDWERPSPAWSGVAIEREFAALGWALEAGGDRQADSYRFSFVRS